MITDHNILIPEHEYRGLPQPSYSLLASVAKQGIDVIYGTKGGMFSLKFGSLVDDMCFEPSKIVNYYRGVAEDPPSGNPKKIIDELLLTITADLGEPNIIGMKTPKIVTDNIASYMTECVQIARRLKIYKNYPDDKIKAVMLDKTKDYFKDMIRSKGKIHIKPSMWDNAEIAANTLRTHDFTRIYFEDQDDMEIFYQYKFIEEVGGIKIKGMLDCLVVDHRNKTIYPVDLKTGELPVTQFSDVMLLYKYYLQASLYRSAMQVIQQKDPDLAGYTVAQFEFVYLSKMNLYKPMIWVVPEELHQAGLNGFTDRYGVVQKGLYELINLYVESKQGNFGLYTKEVYENEGRKMLNGLIKKE